jgi:hypothetical protein
MAAQSKSLLCVINAAHIVLSACLSAALIFVINWSLGGPDGHDLLNSWALFHSSIFIVIPVFALFWWLLYTLLNPIILYLHSKLSPDAEPQPLRISELAFFSLLAAIFGMFIPPIGSLAAVIMGHIARRRCRNQPQLRGSRLALSGLILGYIGVAFGFYIIGMMVYLSFTS